MVAGGGGGCWGWVLAADRGGLSPPGGWGCCGLGVLLGHLLAWWPLVGRRVPGGGVWAVGLAVGCLTYVGAAIGAAPRLGCLKGPGAWQAQHLAEVLVTGEEKGLVLPEHPAVLLLAQLAWLLSSPGSWPISSSPHLGPALPVKDAAAASGQRDRLQLLAFAAVPQK